MTRVTPLALYREWIVQAAHQGAGAAWPPLLGTTCARARWGTLAYVEKVRPQFLSLRQTFSSPLSPLGRTAANPSIKLAFLKKQTVLESTELVGRFNQIERI